MAHWIVDDHGFGGQYYMCSDCGEGWWDIFCNVLIEETCPNCGAVIDIDETEYIENKTSSKTRGMKLLNWNTTVKVKLTDLGKDIYYHQNDEFIKRGLKLTPRYPTEDEDGFCKFQLWDFMQLYGPHIGMCLPNVVEDINFYIEDNVIEEVSHVD